MKETSKRIRKCPGKKNTRAKITAHRGHCVFASLVHAILSTSFYCFWSMYVRRLLSCFRYCPSLCIDFPTRCALNSMPSIWLVQMVFRNYSSVAGLIRSTIVVSYNSIDLPLKQ